MASLHRVHRSKFIAAVLAFMLGGIGAHRLYLEQRGGWAYGAWLVAGMVVFALFGTKETTWIVVIALLPVWIGFAESLGLAVTPDERWDARYNTQSGRRSENGWNCVFLAIIVLLVGTTVCMTTIILAAQFYFEAHNVPLDR